MLGWSAAELANAVELVATIKRYEVQDGIPHANTELSEYKSR